MSWLVRRLAALMPASFRDRYGDEMVEMMIERGRRVRAERGVIAALRYWLTNLLDLVYGLTLGRPRDADGPPVRVDGKRLTTIRSGRLSLVDGIERDVILAARRLARSPGFTAVSVLLLGLGIGANSTIFSALNSVVLRPLPFPEPDRLVQVWESNPEQGWHRFTFSHPNYLDHRDSNESFDQLAAFAEASLNLTEDGKAVQLVAGLATSNLLPALGVEPVVGRHFTEAEDTFGFDERVVLLSHDLWRSRFGARSDILGEELHLSGRTYSVIGVLPPMELWMDLWDVVVPLRPNPDRHRDDHRLGVIGRLADGHDAASAEADLDVIAAALAETYPDSNTGFDTLIVGLHQAVVGTETRLALGLLMGASLFVLLIAITNLANLLLARASRVPGSWHSRSLWAPVVGAS